MGNCLMGNKNKNKAKFLSMPYARCPMPDSPIPNFQFSKKTDS
ncbi:hypothetical protein [Tolypothrix sp. VBCCA 56010]